MIKYNNYNLQLLKQLNNLYKHFNNDKDSYLDLLYLIYKIYYYDNIFLLVQDDIKYNLNSIVQLISTTYDLKLSYCNYDKETQNIIKLIIKIKEITNFNSNFYAPEELKNIIESILLFYNKISIEDIHNSTNIFKVYDIGHYDTKPIMRFFNSYNVDLTDPIITLGNVKIPNFTSLIQSKEIDYEFEFLHLLFKIYGPWLYYGKIFQEGYEYQITEKDIVLDCGGNMGLFSLYCAAQGATVYAFEPMSYTRNFLSISKKLYPDKIHIIPYGVGAFEHEAQFLQTKNPGASTIIQGGVFHQAPGFYEEKCKIITLDEFCENNNIVPTFIKADIEGSELLMLQGAKNIIQQYKPTLNICLNHRDLDNCQISNFINDLNPNYNFSYFYEGEVQSQFVLCKNNA